MAMGEAKPEPSMEDILASIKRIIADDSHAAEEAVSHVEQVSSIGESSRFGISALHLVDDARNADEPAGEEILELTQQIEPAESVAPAKPDFSAEAPARESTRRPEPFVGRDVTPPAPQILSDDAASASRQSLAALSALLVKSDSENGENTLEGLVREMLRPMMKDWLDQKLPELVERLVEKEIARLTGRLG
jgi:uncharacterized protein